MWGTPEADPEADLEADPEADLEADPKHTLKKARLLASACTGNPAQWTGNPIIAHLAGLRGL